MKFKNMVASVLPGIFLIGYNIGTGSITSMSKTGANYGTCMLWTLVISCLITWYLMTLFSKYTMATNETILQAAREKCHPSVPVFFLTAVTVIIIGAVMGVMGVISEVLAEWSVQILNYAIPAVIWSIVLSLLIIIFLWSGTVEVVKKVLSFFVLIMFFAFMLNLFFVFPGLKDIASGLVPRLPQNVANSDNSALLITASMVGTTVSSIVFLIRSILVQEHGWTIKDIRVQQRDAALSVLGMFLVSAALMLAAAGTLYKQGLVLNNAAEMIPLLEPMIGKNSVTVMTFGIVAAGLSSHIPNILVVPWLLCDYEQKPLVLNNRTNRILITVLTLLGTVIPIFGARPVFIMLLSQGLLAVLLPALVVLIFYLSHKIPKDAAWRPSKTDTVILSLVLMFALFMGSVGMMGFIQDLVRFI